MIVSNSDTWRKRVQKSSASQKENENIINSINFSIFSIVKSYNYSKEPTLQIFLEYLEQHNAKFYLLPSLSPFSISFSLILPNQQPFRIHCKIIQNFKINIPISKEFSILLRNSLKSSIQNFLIFIKKDSIDFMDKRKSFRYVSLSDQNKNHVEDIEQLQTTYNKIWKNGLPFGFFDSKNKLNQLTGREWIKFSRTWDLIKAPRRTNKELIHPAKYPESMILPFIRFFTKPGDLVVDPFAGVGSTIIAANQIFRNAIGIEINQKYQKIAKERVKSKISSVLKNNFKQKNNKMKNVLQLSSLKTDYNFLKLVLNNNGENLFYRQYGNFMFPFEENHSKSLQYTPKIYGDIILGDSQKLTQIWKKQKYPKASFCITSPPYWSQLHRKSYRQKERIDKGLDTQYSYSEFDIGNIEDYKGFLKAQKKIFQQVNNILKHKSYIVVITNNIYYKGRLFPLAFDTLSSLSEFWTPKDEKILCQNDKALIPLGVNSAWVGNRCHIYALIFRKE